MIVDREVAWALLNEYTKSESLLKHALGAEAAMRAYADRFSENVPLWGATGLLHDFDYERWPALSEHTFRGAEILAAKGFPEPLIYAIRAHNELQALPRVSLLDKSLYAVDETVGIVQACALVRPNRGITDMEVSSVLKKWKKKEFARGVDRDQIERAAADLGVPLDDHIAVVLAAMKGIAPALGLT
ncbi:MAG: HDIG domain-containing protein [Planctomycetes bacterium]|nr:HDIG domain-containing protein [Planctomycetota bacterium]MBI3844979.1 HDIG domain-containing protein [Planctomycetota bacterium]